MRRLTVLLAVVVAATVGLSASPAWADGVAVRSVDTRDYPTVRLEVLVDGATPKTTEFALRENGEVVRNDRLEIRPLKQTSQPVGTVLVIDTSGSMRSQGAIGQAKAAARSFIEAKNPNDWIALVSFSSQAIIQSDFTQDAAALLAAVDGLAATGETALWDGVTMGARLFEKRTDLQPNLVLLSDGADTVSAGTEQRAVAALTANHAAVFAVGIASDEFDPASLDGFIDAAGGSLTTSNRPEDLTSHFAQVRRAIENQYEVIFTSAGEGGSIALDLTVGGLSTQVQTRAGTVGVAAEPRIVENTGGLFGSSAGKYLIGILAAAAAGLLAWALLLIFGRREQSLEGRLQSYATAPVAVPGEAAATAAHVETNFVQRAVDLTSRMAQRAGKLDKVENVLEQANLPLRPAEALFFYVAGVLLLGLMALLGAPSLSVGVMFAGIVAALPIVTLKVLRKRRLKAFEEQLPDTLNLLCGSLRAGYSFLQGVEAVAQETTDPMARELRRVLAEARLGRPLEDALEDVAIRMQSRDFDWSVMAIRIQREVGGNLAELLETVAETMVQRSRLRGEVRALTAEGRLSAVIMGLLPIGLGGFMFMSSPDYIGALFESLIGWAMVIGSGVMGVFGFFWLQKIIKIEV